MRRRFEARYRSGRQRNRPCPGFLLLLLGPLLLPTAASGQASLPAGWDGGLFELSLRGVTPKTVLAVLNARGGVLIPVSDLLALIGAEAAETEAGALALAVSKEGGISELHLGRSLIVTPEGDSISIPGDEMYLSSGRLFLGTEPLAVWLNGRVETQWDLLKITLSRDPPFPVQGQLERLVARQRILRSMAFIEPPLSTLTAPQPSSSGLGILSWTLSSGGFDPRNQTSAVLQLGGAFLGGEVALGGSGAAGTQIKDRFRLGNFAYRKSFPDRNIIRDFHAGDVTTRGTIRRPIRGFVVTNRPRSLPSLFDEVLINPDLPPGWEYEVYGGGQLLAYSEVADPGPRSVPLSFGRNNLEVRMYGPSGQEVVTSAVYQVPLEQLSKGRTEYSLGGGRCGTGASCDYLGFLELRHGLFNGLTVGGGAEAIRDSLGGFSVRPSFGLNLLSSNGWLAQLQAISKIYMDASLQYSGPGSIRGAIQGTLYSSGMGLMGPTTGQGDRWRVTASLSSALGRVLVSARGLEGEGAEHFNASLGRPFRFGFLQALYESELYRERSRFGARLTSGWTDRFLQGSTGVLAVFGREGGLDQAEVGLTTTVGSGMFLTGTARWRQDFGTSFSLSFSKSLGFGRVFSHVRSTAGGGPRAHYQLSGTLAYDDEGGISAFNQRTMGVSGVRGRVFYDRNGDGVMGADEPPAPGLFLTAGPHRGETDENGRFRIWGIAPYQTFAVQLDTIRTFLPDWAPPQRRVLLRAVPNLYRTVNIGLVPTKELLGTITVGPQIVTPGGITLEVENLESGEIQTVLTFADGTYYLPRVRPGRYRLTPSESSLQVLGAQASPESREFTVEVDDKDPYMELQGIHLTRVFMPQWREREGYRNESSGLSIVDRAAQQVFGTESDTEARNLDSPDGDGPSPPTPGTPDQDIPDRSSHSVLTIPLSGLEGDQPNPSTTSNRSRVDEGPVKPPSQSEVDRGAVKAPSGTEEAQERLPGTEGPGVRIPEAVSPDEAQRPEPGPSAKASRREDRSVASETDASRGPSGELVRTGPVGFVTTRLERDLGGPPPQPGHPDSDSRRDPAPVRPPLAVQWSSGFRTRRLARGRHRHRGQPGPLMWPSRRARRMHTHAAQEARPERAVLMME